jgi:hypothetical protein
MTTLRFLLPTLAFVLSFLGTLGCAPTASPAPTVDIGGIQTQAALSVFWTQTASVPTVDVEGVKTEAALSIFGAQTASAPTATSTAQPSDTPRPFPPTPNPAPTATQPDERVVSEPTSPSNIPISTLSLSDMGGTDVACWQWQESGDPRGATCRYSDWPPTPTYPSICVGYRLPSTENILRYTGGPPIRGIERLNGAKVYYDIADAEYWDENEKGSTTYYHCPAEAEAAGYVAGHPK